MIGPSPKGRVRRQETQLQVGNGIQLGPVTRQRGRKGHRIGGSQTTGLAQQWKTHNPHTRFTHAHTFFEPSQRTGGRNHEG